MDLRVDNSYDGRYHSEVLFYNTLTHTFDLEVKAADRQLISKFCLKAFNSAYFPSNMMVGIMTDIGPRFFNNTPLPLP